MSGGGDRSSRYTNMHKVLQGAFFIDRDSKKRNGPGADTIPRRLKPLPNLYKLTLEDGLKESPKHVRQKQIRKINFKKFRHYVGYYTISFQNARSLQHKFTT
jgi:hypothetical protein